MWLQKANHQHDGVSQNSVERPIFKVLSVVQDYYQYHLKNNDTARSYLYSRGFDDNIIDKFKLGYSPQGYSQLLAQAKNKVWRNNLQRVIDYSMSPEELTDTIHALLELSGVVRHGLNSAPFDRFRDRIIFPIFDASGNTVSFGGRVFTQDSHGPKYLNGSESIVFKKNEVVFGENFLDPQTHYNEIIVTEGYMDVASLHQFEIENAVATMGTAISEYQVQRLFNYTNNLIFCFDGDDAGEKAAARAVKNARGALKGNNQVYVVFLPKGEDPDSILRAHSDVDSGRDAFLSYLDTKTNCQNYLLRLALDRLGLQWGDNDQYVMAHLLNDIMQMPEDSDVAKKIKSFIQTQSQQKAMLHDGMGHQQIVNWCAENTR